MREDFHDTAAVQLAKHLGIAVSMNNDFLEARFISFKPPQKLSEVALIFYFNFLVVLKQGGEDGQDRVIDEHRAIMLCNFYSKLGRVECRLLYRLSPQKEHRLILGFRNRVDNYRIQHSIELQRCSRTKRCYLGILGIARRFQPDGSAASSSGHIVLQRRVVLAPMEHPCCRDYYRRLS